MGNEENIMIIASIEDYLHLANEEIKKLDAKTKGQKVTRSQAFEDINYIQRASIHNLRKEFEGD